MGGGGFRTTRRTTTLCSREVEGTTMNFLFHHRVPAIKNKTYYAENSGLGRVELKMLAKAIRSLGFKVEGGTYDFDDVVTILQTMGLNPMPTKIKSLYRGMALPLDKHLTFGEISHLWARFLTEKKHEETMIRLAFEYFDKDNSGYITSDEFLAAMSELGDPLTEQEVATFLKHFDVDSDGKVNLLLNSNLSLPLVRRPRLAPSADAGALPSSPALAMVRGNRYNIVNSSRRSSRKRRESIPSWVERKFCRSRARSRIRSNELPFNKSCTMINLTPAGLYVPGVLYSLLARRGDGNKAIA